MLPRISWRLARATCARLGDRQLVSKRLERCAHLGGEKLRLFPGREVGALRQFVVVDELRICLLRPTARGLIELARFIETN